MSAKRRGRFIVFEGLDGAGTTTQSSALVRRMEKEGLSVLLTREPSDGPIGTQIRQALTGRLGLPNKRGSLTAETLALLFAADRMDHLEAQVLPSLAAGQHVVSDRYVLSSLAYQGAYLPMEWVAALNKEAKAADLTLFLEVGVRVAEKRRAVRGGAEELFDRAQQKIAKEYRAALAMRGAAEKVVRVDGQKSVEAVGDACWSAVSKLLKRAS